MIHKEFEFCLHKTNFYGQYWQPKETKAVVILLHGMGGHSSRYAYVIEKFIASDFAIVSYDNFGHGKTSGKRGHNPNFKALLDVIDKVIEISINLYPNKPIFLYGHSMGGNLVINYSLRKENNLNGVVATSPFLKLAFQPPKWKMALGKVLQKIAPFITLKNKLNPSHVSRDLKEINKYMSDSLAHNKISPNYSLVMIETGEWAIKNAHTLNVPMFVVHGDKDKIIDHKASVDFTENTNIASLKLYKNGYHELHNDLCKDIVLDDVVNWLESKL